MKIMKNVGVVITVIGILLYLSALGEDLSNGQIFGLALWGSSVTILGYLVYRLSGGRSWFEGPYAPLPVDYCKINRRY